MRFSSWHSGTILVAMASVLCAQHPVMEVLAGPGRPSTLLVEHLQKHRVTFVVVDIGLWVQELVGSALGGTWANLEQQRRMQLRDLLASMCERLPAPAQSADVLGGIAHVAHVLLTNDAARALALAPPWRTEIAAVVNGERAPRPWLPAAEPVDWAMASPNGAYVSEHLEPLFRATRYLQVSLEQLTMPQRDAWQSAVEAATAGQQGKVLRVAAVANDSALRMLLGSEVGPMPAVIGPLSPGHSVDRLLLATADPAPWWERLAVVHERGPGKGSDLRTLVLRVAHELATEAPDDDWLAAYGHAGWRRKWLDLADYTYVGVREVDVLAGVLCRGEDVERPRLLVEPLPRSFAALQAAFRDTDAVYAAIGDAPISTDFVQQIGDCLALLDHQRGGTEPPMELLDRVWQMLLHGFDQSQRDCPETRLEGIAGPLRRTGCHLVRIPIRWRGEHTSAVAFHWWVDHREPDGSWRRAAR
ncbi:MAG: hypothetical protein MUC36_29265 [Planctomycetes bacterium]|nr:hypothetical protein [Planctomycetota bacterium]